MPQSSRFGSMNRGALGPTGRLRWKQGGIKDIDIGEDDDEGSSASAPQTGISAAVARDLAVKARQGSAEVTT